MEDTGITDGSNGELRTDSVSQVYAQALLEMAEATGELESITSEVEELAQLLRSERALKNLLASPALGQVARRDLIHRVFHERVSDVLYRFLQVVNDKDRLSSLPGIVRAYTDLIAERNGIVEADVWVPQKVDAQQLERISEGLARSLGVSQVVAHQYEDPSLIGGLRIRVGDRLIDASVATQLKRLRQRLGRRGREQARQSHAIEEDKQ